MPPINSIRTLLFLNCTGFLNLKTDANKIRVNNSAENTYSAIVSTCPIDNFEVGNFVVALYNESNKHSTSKSCLNFVKYIEFMALKHCCMGSTSIQLFPKK